MARAALATLDANEGVLAAGHQGPTAHAATQGVGGNNVTVIGVPGKAVPPTIPTPSNRVAPTTGSNGAMYSASGRPMAYSSGSPRAASSPAVQPMTRTMSTGMKYLQSNASPPVSGISSRNTGGGTTNPNPNAANNGGRLIEVKQQSAPVSVNPPLSPSSNAGSMMIPPNSTLPAVAINDSDEPASRGDTPTNHLLFSTSQTNPNVASSSSSSMLPPSSGAETRFRHPNANPAAPTTSSHDVMILSSGSAANQLLRNLAAPNNNGVPSNANTSVGMTSGSGPTLTLSTSSSAMISPATSPPQPTHS